MKTTMLALFFLLGLGFTHAEEATRSSQPKEAFHVYLLIGQSNMAGRAAIDPELTGAIPATYLLNREGEWEPARNPLNRYSTIRKGLGMQQLNPGDSFARAMAASDADKRIGLVVNAKGGTKIEQWAKGTHFYKEAVRRARQARQHGTLKGILWHQGESNHNAPEGYAKKLAQMVGDLRQDLQAPDLPFVAGQIIGPSPINQEIAQLPELCPHTAVVPSEGLKTKDRWHFDADSMKMLGRRYAEAMQALLE